MLEIKVQTRRAIPTFIAPTGPYCTSRNYFGIAARARHDSRVYRVSQEFRVRADLIQLAKPFLSLFKHRLDQTPEFLRVRRCERDPGEEPSNRIDIRARALKTKGRRFAERPHQNHRMDRETIHVLLPHSIV